MTTSKESNKRYAERVFRSLNYSGVNVSPAQFPDRNPYLLSDREEPSNLSLGPWIQTLDSLSDEEIHDGIFYIYFTYDIDALPFLKRIQQCGGIFIPPAPSMMEKTNYHLGVNRWAHEAMLATWAMKNSLSHLNVSIHENICEALEITRNLEGAYVEIGVYRGGSAATALHYIDICCQNQRMEPRCVYLIDTFDGFNYESAATGTDPIWTGTHKLGGAQAAQGHISRIFEHIQTDIALVEANICEEELPDTVRSIAAANIDVDGYEPTLKALQKVARKLVPGGVIICEDSASTPALYGAYLAMEEFLDSDAGQCYTKIFKGGQYFLIKRS
jgi:hypothetical protein